MGRIVTHAVNGFMLVLFVLAAVVQYNDPDPLLWIVVYGAGALCCALFMIGRLPVALSALVGGLCLFGTLYLLVQILLGPSIFVDETGREMMGLMEKGRELLGFAITALWTGFLTWWMYRIPGAASASFGASS